LFHKKLQVHIVEKLRKPQFKMTTAWIPQFMFMGFFMITMLAWFTQPVYAADIFSMAKSAMQKVYNDVVGIATVAAVVCSAVCLFLMNFSKSGKTVDESRTWLKRIVICWAVLMVLGAIVNYMEVLVPQQNFTG
jgi:succinate dehydrogenase/fumarate reductase cytochrome b subunit